MVPHYLPGMARTISRAVGAVLSFVAALVVAGVGGCNVHEMGHLVTGRLAGVPVNDIFWCTPVSGRIAFAYQEPAWVGYAGGLTAALVLLALYWAVVLPRLDSAYWWSAGVAMLGTAISQVIVGLFEGSDPVRYGETQANSAGLAVLVVGPLLLAAITQFIVHKPILPGRKRSEQTDLL